MVLTGCCGTGGVVNPQVYEPILPEEVIQCAPLSFKIEYMKHSCILEIVRGEKPSDDCKELLDK